MCPPYSSNRREPRSFPFPAGRRDAAGCRYRLPVRRRLPSCDEEAQVWQGVVLPSRLPRKAVGRPSRPSRTPRTSSGRSSAPSSSSGTPRASRSSASTPAATGGFDRRYYWQIRWARVPAGLKARLARLRFCESTNNPRATNGSHWGYFQFDIRTWHEAQSAARIPAGRRTARADYASPIMQNVVTAAFFPGNEGRWACRA